jgi:hypothetical protein
MKKTSLITIIILIFLWSCGKKEKEKPAVPDTVVTETTVKDTTIKPAETDTLKQAETPPQNPVPPEPAPQPAEDLSVMELWEKYREFREASKVALNNSEFQQALTNLKLAAKYASQLERDDLAAWQYNNIGYYSILEFKGRTNYDFRIHNLRTFTNQKERDAYLEETKKIFKENLKILTDAETYLEKAYEIDKKYDDQNRTDKIYSNLKYIDWVKNFLNN